MARHRAQRLRDLSKCTKRWVAAEEDACKKHQEELNILMCAAERGQEWSSLEPEIALSLAHAVKNTLEAEEEAITQKIKEAEKLLETLKDASDEAAGCSGDAAFQLGSLTSYFDKTGLQVDISDLKFEPSSYRPPGDGDRLFPSSDSDIYDAGEYDESGSEEDDTDTGS